MPSSSSVLTRGPIVALTIGALLAVAGCSNAEPAAESASGAAGGTLTFASIPSESAVSLDQQYENITKALEQELGVTVEVQEATNYAAVIEALRAGQVDIAALGPFSYVVAADSDAGVRPVGSLADSADEPASYRSYGIVPAGSDIKDLEGFKGKKVCFVDPTSTSGFLFPSAGLMDAGIDPEKDVTGTFAGGHDSSALSVADGTCDAGFAFDEMVNSVLIDSGQLEEGALEVVWESEDIPNSPVAVSTKLPTEQQDEIERVFQEVINKPGLVKAGICSDEESCVLPEESEYGFIPVEDSVYDGIRSVCETTKSESCKA